MKKKLVFLSAVIFLRIFGNTNKFPYSLENGIGLNLIILLIVLIAAIILLLIVWKRSLRKEVSNRTNDLKNDLGVLQKLEAELRESETKFRLIFENAPIGMAMKDMESNLVNINQAYADILGYSREELMAGEFEKVGYAEDVEKSEAQYKKLMTGEKSVHIEKRLLKKDKSIIYVSQRLVFIKDTQNVPLFLLGMTIDITQRVKALNKLRENDEFYKSVLHNMSGIVYNCAWDLERTMSYISKGIESISGYSNEEFINNKLRNYISIIHRDDRERVINHINNGLKAEKTFNFEYRILCRDGSIAWVYEIGRGVYNDQNELLHLTGTIINVTERKSTEIELDNYRKHLEELVEKRTRELEEKNQSLEEFNKLFVGREFRIKELRDEVKKLKEQSSTSS